MKNKVMMLLLGTTAVSLISVAGAAPRLTLQPVEIIYSTATGDTDTAGFTVNLSDPSNFTGAIQGKRWHNSANNQTVALGTPFKAQDGLDLVALLSNPVVAGSFDITYTATSLTGKESVTKTYTITVSNDGKSGDGSTFTAIDDLAYSADGQMMCEFVANNDTSLDTPSRPFIEVQCATSSKASI